MKLISFYLPQFHETPENNKWWGEGFTEWTNTRKAEPLFKGHDQPKEPLNKNYYNLLDPATLEWQAKLADNYGINGFCFYHYWFKGKKLLEKPAEILLNNKHINTEYCFSWANEPWTRSWDGKNKEVLQEQSYGDTEDWLNHIKYLLPFFEDPRYIKVENRPVLVIYRPRSIDKLDEMLDVWNKYLKTRGLENIYLIDMLTSFDKHPISQSNASINFEPMLTLKHYLPKKYILRRGYKKILRNLANKVNLYPKKLLDKIPYEIVWKSIENRDKSDQDPKKIYGAFVSWDNTARKNLNGLVLSGFNVRTFEEGLKKQISRSVKSNKDFLFVNAWNEWAEGTYLEPDEKYKLEILESVKRAVEENSGGN